MNSKTAKRLRGVISAAVSMGHGRISCGEIMRIPVEMQQDRRNELIWVRSKEDIKNNVPRHRAVKRGTPAVLPKTSMRAAYKMMRKTLGNRDAT